MSNSNFFMSCLLDSFAELASRSLNIMWSLLYSAGILVIIVICGLIFGFPSISIPLSIEHCSWMVRIRWFSLPSLVSPCSSKVILYSIYVCFCWMICSLIVLSRFQSFSQSIMFDLMALVASDSIGPAWFPWVTSVLWLSYWLVQMLTGLNRLVLAGPAVVGFVSSGCLT